MKIKVEREAGGQGGAMKATLTWLAVCYEAIIIRWPRLCLAAVFLVCCFFAVFIPQFRLDASSESLSLENDQALKYYRSIKARYGSDDYLVITFTPHQDLFAPASLKTLGQLRDELSTVEGAASVLTILDVPLIDSHGPDVTLDPQSLPSFDSPVTDPDKAREELLNSPIYEDLLISADGTTTALLLRFEDNPVLEGLITARDHLLEQALSAPLSVQDRQRLSDITQAYKAENKLAQIEESESIEAIRAILSRYTNQADIYLGGVPMIIADSIAYIRYDLAVFGSLVLGFLVIMLGLIFRAVRWVVLPLLTCGAVGVVMIGFLGLMNWPVTIVSANFISLLLIFTLSFCLHQIVRYLEAVRDDPDGTPATLVRISVFHIGIPCFYMAFTTAVGFASLIISDIQPVIDFGWLMSVGILISFAIAFTMMPAMMVLLPRPAPMRGFDLTHHITGFFARLVAHHGRMILLGFGVAFLFGVIGLQFLNVQNRFIDYYKADTPIYQGMTVIDQKLGGTTPMDIIIDAPASYLAHQAEEKAAMEDEDMWIASSGPAIIDGYWMNETLLEELGEIHSYIDSLPETGKVLSLHTSMQFLQGLDEGRTLDRFALGVAYTQMDEVARDILFTPYIADDGNQIRIAARIYETHQGLNREEMLSTIRQTLEQEHDLSAEQLHISGIVVLYNNILQTLFQSQILTIGMVFLTIFVIFTILFRNLFIAAVAIIPNIAVVVLVLGLMGWLGIPLDIMTITIAAICFGMADDDTIHYVHRFMHEYRQCGDYRAAVRRSHNTIGRAMYYTSLTILFGFSILAFSNFVPTIYFGLLTGFSMLVALLADLLLLPLLITLFKPLGPEHGK